MSDGVAEVPEPATGGVSKDLVDAVLTPSPAAGTGRTGRSPV
jgi:hypothetical protein